MKNNILLQINNTVIKECNSNTSILDNILNKNLYLSHSCKNGRCNNCKVKVVKGTYNIITEELSLSDLEKQNNIHLSCCIAPKSNMRILSDNFHNFDLPKSLIFPVKVSKIIEHTKSIRSIFLRMPKDIEFQFFHGQHIDIKLFHSFRSYSIASFDSNKKIIEIIVKDLKKGLFSRYWFDHCKTNELLLVEGPKGGSFIDYKTKEKKLIFIATGVGIAPILSILKSKKIIRKFEKIYVIWGNRYNDDEFLNLQKEFKFINYFKCFSKNMNGHHSYVQDIIKNNFNNLKDFYAYACGSYKMVEDTKQICLKRGLKNTNFISDAFVQTGK